MRPGWSCRRTPDRPNQRSERSSVAACHSFGRLSAERHSRGAGGSETAEVGSPTESDPRGSNSSAGCAACGGAARCRKLRNWGHPSPEYRSLEPVIRAARALRIGAGRPSRHGLPPQQHRVAETVSASEAMDQFRVTFSATGAATDLWAFGEDELADAALKFSDEELLAAWRTAAVSTTRPLSLYPSRAEG